MYYWFLDDIHEHTAEFQHCIQKPLGWMERDKRSVLMLSNRPSCDNENVL